MPLKDDSEKLCCLERMQIKIVQKYTLLQNCKEATDTEKFDLFSGNEQKKKQQNNKKKNTKTNIQGKLYAPRNAASASDDAYHY